MEEIFLLIENNVVVAKCEATCKINAAGIFIKEDKLAAYTTTNKYPWDNCRIISENDYLNELKLNAFEIEHC